MFCEFFVPGAAVRTARFTVGDSYICRASMVRKSELSKSPATMTLPRMLQRRVVELTPPQRSSNNRFDRFSMWKNAGDGRPVVAHAPPLLERSPMRERAVTDPAVSKP